ncbi:hypothetical protein [Psychrobacter glacincola]|uniref:hypothetical protein n=1 Tax=Psychrobacter glacincola TaxID=56810 RepID=UPI0039B009F0
MNKTDVFEEKINVDGIVNVLSMKFYIDEDLPYQICFIIFETGSLGVIYLKVDNDTDQLYWSVENPIINSSDTYKEVENPFSADSFTVVFYWHMIGHSGSHDAIQFYTRVESDSHTQISYMQFMGEASGISCYEFGKSTNSLK